MIKKIRSMVAFLIVLTLLLSCAPVAFAATTDLTYQEYLKMTTEEQLAFRSEFASNAAFIKWYRAAKQEYEDNLNKVVIGTDQSVDLGELLNPTLGSGTCGDNLSWSLSEDGVLTITGSGNIYAYTTDSPAPWNEYAESIKKVELPINLSSVGVNAFAACTAITDVYYAGTETQWLAVTVNEGNDPLTNATLHTATPVLTQIAVTTQPTKTAYAWGEELDTTGLVLTATYHDGTQEEINNGFQTSGYDPETSGAQKVTVTYQGKTTTFDVTVANPALSSISIQTLPNKTKYFVGDSSLDTAGLVLKLTFANNSTSTVDTGFTTSGFDSTSVGSKTVTVTYEGKTATFDVTVVQPTLTGIAIKTEPTKLNYWVGEELDTDGLVLTATYEDNTTEEITYGFQYTGFDSETAGTKTVTVTYEGETATFNVTVTEPSLIGIAIKTEPTKLNYWVGEELDTDGLVLTATYEDNTTEEITDGFQCTGFDSETAGTQTVTVHYGGFTDTFDVNVTLGGECGEELTWTMDDAGVLTITGTGAMYDYELGTAPWDTDAVTHIVLDADVTSIGKLAFAGCTNLTEFTIPAGVTVGDGAFAYCDNLTAINVSEDHETYCSDNGVLYSKDKTELIQVPGSFTGTFTVPGGVTSIGSYAFAGCSNLTAVEYTGSSTVTGGYAPRGEEGESSTTVSILFGESSITSIGSYAFAGCESLSAIDLPVKVTSINEGTFADCIALTHITIPSGVTSIGDSAFANCSALNSIVYAGKKTTWTGITMGTGNDVLSTSPVLFKSDITFKSAAPTLYDNIAMNYSVSKTLFDEMGVTNPYLVVSFRGVETTLTDYTVSEEGDQFVFTFYDIAPHLMDETMTATIYATYNGKVYEGKTLEYSVATYCYRMLDKCSDDTYAELRTLLVDLLHYGAATQSYTGYEGELVDARLTDDQLVWGTQIDPELYSDTAHSAKVDAPTASWKSAGLVLDDAITMYFQFETTDDISGLTVKITSDTNTEGWVIDSDDLLYNESTGRYHVSFGGLDASKMRERVYVTVYNGDTAISHTLCYSIVSYAYSKQANTDTNLVALVKAMMRYGDAAYAYANPQGDE